MASELSEERDFAMAQVEREKRGKRWEGEGKVDDARERCSPFFFFFFFLPSFLSFGSRITGVPLT